MDFLIDRAWPSAIRPNTTCALGLLRLLKEELAAGFPENCHFIPLYNPEKPMGFKKKKLFGKQFLIYGRVAKIVVSVNPSPSFPEG